MTVHAKPDSRPPGRRATGANGRKWAADTGGRGRDRLVAGCGRFHI